MTDVHVDHVTCLGCGCGCDDIAVTVRDGRIIQTSPACPVSRSWFGDGSVPWAVLRDGQPATLEEAVSTAAGLLGAAAGKLLVYIGPDLSAQAQRNAVMLGDLLRGVVDTSTSEGGAAGILAGQRRGRATATLGEIRNRADVVVFWGVDPAQRYPRFQSRYAPAPSGTQVPNGRGGRFVISVSIGADKGPADADLTLALDPAEEIPALSLMRAVVAERLPTNVGPSLQRAVELVPRLAAARYAVLVHDAEPTEEPRHRLRSEALIGLTQSLNAHTRAALLSLRAGGNRPGAESVLTWQTGFPFAVDHSRGFPRYTPEERGLTRLSRGGFQAALIVGTPTLPQEAMTALQSIGTVAIGPGASRAGFGARVAIDTGVAGIHEGGTAYRMDDVPLPLRPPLTGERTAVEILASLAETLRAGRGSA
jgi:formylmethanofuran dehydrogenase subunit B